ncbi:hypothetical protein CSV79_16120 [Sporosarcina sp. P13]|uniref:AAA family ATPase n=1 Tax=Sporosarcina sp. P13 TaxID=2048263 RepID=UPI000C16A767|nr:AAA family ATPase [Sporosarcina sp. P13]PIC62615.1 hypothetical protein CSV79_16120 [Sporosarcina sp. P13]
MEKMIIKFGNCYGINQLEHVFDFTNNKSTQLIYSPNGIMKTSLANTFDDFSKGVESSDRMNPTLETRREIIDQTGTQIDTESIFVIKPYEKSFKSKTVSTLLVNDDLKQEYEKVSEKINSQIDQLVNNLNRSAGLRKDTVKKFCNAFGNNEKDFIKTLLEIHSKFDKYPNSGFEKIKYNSVFDSKVTTLILNSEFQTHIEAYIEKYDELVSVSSIFQKDFNHFNAITIHKQLKDNGYFNANHSVMLNVKGEKVEKDNPVELLDEINKAKEELFEDMQLKDIFEKIDKKLTTAQLREFRDLLLDNQFIIPELKDLPNLEIKLWVSYLHENIDQFNIVVKDYLAGQEILMQVLEKAREERTEWEKVIDIFNSRFYVPYNLEIENREDAMLKEEAPSIKYYFNNQSESVEEDLLWQVLSQGERRTLYLLNIIFEIESRKNQGIETVFIVDDIADSFDYKNKYAIIEYLKDISNTEIFKLIILTHNFDFLRTVQDRISNGRSRYEASFMAIKEEEAIVLERLSYKYISNPFNDWKTNLTEGSKLIASVTFARNLAEYTGDSDSFNKLTSILHLKNKTKDITVGDIESIYKDIFKDLADLDLPDKEKTIYDIIMSVSREIIAGATQEVNLENKVVLSIAIRLLAEEYMIYKINDEEIIKRINKNQTGMLFKEYKKIATVGSESLIVLERVNIMTPENIHLNSFMFEPILDLSNHHLSKLYSDVTLLVESLELSTV